MEQLSQTLKLAGATIEEITLQPTEKEPKAVLVVSARFTTEQAEVLDCRDMFYDGKGTPRLFEGHVGLPHLLKETVLTIGPTIGPVSLMPDLAHKFRVGHDNDVSLRLTCRIHLSGPAYLQLLLDFFSGTNKEPFDLELAPRQGQLFAEGQEPANDAAEPE